MSKNKDKRLEEKEKLDAEVARSLSVVKMKETHRQIEEIEKSRKKSAIISISKRLNNLISLCKATGNGIKALKKNFPNHYFNTKPPDGVTGIENYLQHILKTYESIRFDLQRNLKLKPEDFEKLFPKPPLNFETYNNIIESLTCLSAHMIDMLVYCQRLI